ncbi:MAG: helix-turn-helix domain-containing protein [Turicibacter sp.]|nr:helix-turn-helix domain-containing protein [Turicibacter sp.]
MTTIGNSISKVRKEAGLTQQQVANHLNVVRTSISNWENGTRTPDAEILVKLAELFNVSVDYLLGKQTTPKNKTANPTVPIFQELDKVTQDMLIDINSLNNNEREELKNFIDFIKSKKNKTM